MCFVDKKLYEDIHTVNEEETIRTLSDLKVTMWLATIRGIFDSKYNEFMMSNDYKTYSKFPDFVYSWL